MSLRWKFNPWHVYECLCVRWIFGAGRRGKKLTFWLSSPYLWELELFRSYFVFKFSFREILITEMVIFDQNKSIWLIFKFQKSKIEISVICTCTFIIHKNENSTSTQLILKSNFTSFKFYNICFQMNDKKLPGGFGKWRTLSIFFFEVELQVYTHIQAISTLECFLFDDNGLVMCKYSILFNRCLNKQRSWKWPFRTLKSFHRSQFWTYRLRTGFIAKRKKVRIWLYLCTLIHW